GLARSAAGIVVPAYYFRWWLPTRALSPVQHLGWQLLVRLLLEARRDLGLESLDALVLPVPDLAGLLASSEQTVRRHMVQAAAADSPELFAAFVNRVSQVEAAHWATLRALHAEDTV